MPKDAAIFDVACGTGMFGKLLKDQGYTNLVGADASSNFVRAAGESGIYTQTFEHWFGMGVDKFPKAHRNRYDLVTASGCLSKGHIEKDGLDDIHAALKVGGLLVAGWRSYRLVPGAETGFFEKLEAMKVEGKLIAVRQFEIMRGLTGKHLDEAVKQEFEKGIQRFEQQSSTITIHQKTA